MRTDSVMKVLPGERFTPTGLAGKFNAKAILESSSLMKGRERYSILLLDEAFRVVQRGEDVLLLKKGKSYRIKTSRHAETAEKYHAETAGSSEASGSAKENPYHDILDVLVYFAKQNPALHQDLPCPFGGIGYLSYEFARFCDTIKFSKPVPDPLARGRKKKHEISTFDAEFLFGHMYIIFDHYTDLLYLIGVNYRESVIDLEKALKQVEQRLNDLDFNYLSQDIAAGNIELVPDAGEAERFRTGVSTVRNHIIAGNLLQGVLSRRLRIRTDLDAFDGYRQLRSINPSPYMFYLDFPDHQIFGTSPEVMVKVKNGKAVLRPIAGTRRRGKSRDEDMRLEQELKEDEKERAEHLMLIDLARNDLGRVCRPGTVQVTEYMGVERYSHLMHLVSQVEGELRADVNAPDVIRACFPAGTVTGAPKIRAIEIIDSLEKEPRGFYAGLVGYVEADGNFDTCIAIRTALKNKRSGEIILQAGAGIVYDSNPARELEETNEKLRALAAAVGLEI